MRMQDNVVVIPDVLTPDECNAIIAELDQREHRDGGVYKRDEGKVVDKRVRACWEYQVPFTEFADLRYKLRTVGLDANEEHFDFNVCDTLYDRMLYVHYYNGGFFERHKDAYEDSELGFKKLAMVLQLSPPEEFQGGILEIKGFGPQPYKQGQVIMFPVYLEHSVTRTDGNRKVIINWLTSSTPFR